MCLAIPALVVSIDGFEAQVEVGGISRSISLRLTPEAQVGDYVYVHAGFSISVVDEEEALESLRILRELAEEYPAGELFYSTGDLTPKDAEGATALD
jgi:hydrogenase expression/formation protein HypC